MPSSYIKGDKITSIDELDKQEFIFFYNTVYHKAWFENWQFGWIKHQIQQGRLFKATKKFKKQLFITWLKKQPLYLLSDNVDVRTLAFSITVTPRFPKTYKKETLMEYVRTHYDSTPEPTPEHFNELYDLYIEDEEKRKKRMIANEK